MPKNIVFQIDGGIGKCIAATAVCSAIRKQYPNDTLIVISGYPDVFVNNPNVDKSFQFGQVSYFFNDHIKNKETKLMLHNPYLENDYVHANKHLIQVWCEMNDIQYNNEKPEMYLTNREIEFFQKKYVSDKPIMVMQTNGGGQSDLKYSFARDLPTCVVEPVIEHFSVTHNIVHIRRDDQIGYEKTTPITSSIRDILSLTMLSKKRLLIDSFLQHGCAALEIPAVVCWITNTPKTLGYDLHDNILANPFTRKPDLRNSFISEFNIGGDPIEFPYNSENEIFDTDKIINALEKQ